VSDDAGDIRHVEEVRHVAELVDRARIGMLTTMTESGKHVSRPMALREVELTVTWPGKRRSFTTVSEPNGCEPPS
jgi:general stress protein 26